VTASLTITNRFMTVGGTNTSTATANPDTYLPGYH
jgi:hypothetical protein